MGNVPWRSEVYGFLMIILFRLIGSKQMHSFKLPDLFLPSTSTKLLIQCVPSCTGLSTPSCNILSTSCLNASLRWIGIGWQGVCLGVTLGSSCIWEAANPFKDIWVFMQNLFFACDQLGNCKLLSWHLSSHFMCRSLSRHFLLLYTQCRFSFLGVISWACYQASVANSPILFLVVSIQASMLFYKIVTCCHHLQQQRMPHPSITWYPWTK